MPDLTTENFYECESVDDFRCGVPGKGNIVYIVEVNRNVPNGWTCTCSSYKYKSFGEGKVYCKHIIQVQEEKYCGWMEFLTGDNPKMGAPGEGYLCPNCGRKAIGKGWAV